MPCGWSARRSVAPLGSTASCRQERRQAGALVLRGWQAPRGHRGGQCSLAGCKLWCAYGAMLTDQQFTHSGKIVEKDWRRVKQLGLNRRSRHRASWGVVCCRVCLRHTRSGGSLLSPPEAAAAGPHRGPTVRTYCSLRPRPFRPWRGSSAAPRCPPSISCCCVPMRLPAGGQRCCQPTAHIKLLPAGGQTSS